MPVGTKRKRTAKGVGPAPKSAKMSKAAQRDFEDQYYQGVDTLELEGCGLGTYLLGTPHLPFLSPLEEPMRFEIMSGTKGQSCIRLCAHGKRLKDVLVSNLIVPFRHIEQFIIIDEPSLESSAASGEQAYRAIIVPTAAVGASPLKRTYPKVIQFKLPEQKAGKDFKGTIGDANDEPNETYRSLITRVVSEELTPYEKTVVDATSTAATAVSEHESHTRIICDVTLKLEEEKDVKVKGQLFFLKTGIFFHSPTTVLYLTAKSTPSAMIIHNFEGSHKEPTNLTLICPTSEPYYEDGRDTPAYISFHGINQDMSTSISQHTSRYGIELSELEQKWYSLEQEQPMTGWLPRGFGI